MTTTTSITAEKVHTGTISLPPSSSHANNLEKSVFKKPARLSPDKMGIVIHEPFVKALHVDDNITWFQQTLTDQGLLLKPVHGMPSLHDP
jgi:hypothetical protein